MFVSSSAIVLCLWSICYFPYKEMHFIVPHSSNNDGEGRSVQWKGRGGGGGEVILLPQTNILCCRACSEYTDLLGSPVGYRDFDTSSPLQ